MIKTHKNLLLTFDYELFLGKRSGTVHKCLLYPTKRILEILNEHGAKGIFFVDTTYLMQLKEAAQDNSDASEDFNLIAEQLREIASNHYVYPHIHPHWLNAKYLHEINQWDLTDTTHYRLHSISENERASLFEKSVNIIRELLGNPNYRIDGYRAGGWCIQPFVDFKPYFEIHGIHTDFSVMPGKRNVTEAQYFDFACAPKKYIYMFENDPVVECIGGNFRECTISTISLSSFIRLSEKMLLKYLWKTGNRNTGDGLSVNMPNRIADLSPEIEMVSIELLNLAKLPLYLKYFSQNNYMHFISHPKMLSKHNIRIFKKFMEKAFSSYQIETDHNKMTS
jgi:hypothetical protein